jgi:hypothetical protein
VAVGSGHGGRPAPAAPAIRLIMRWSGQREAVQNAFAEASATRGSYTSPLGLLGSSASRRISRGSGKRSARAVPGQTGVVCYPVVALKMSLLPKLAGQSPSGHGAGSTTRPASDDCWRQASIAGQSALRRVSVHVPAP